MGKDRNLLLVVIIASLLGISMQYIFTYYYSYTGTAIATLITELLVMVLTLIQVKKLIKIRVTNNFWKAALLLLIGQIALLQMVTFLVDNMMLQLSLGIILSLCWFIVVTYIFKITLWEKLFDSGRWLPLLKVKA
jgi:O-antigen/teichoic acid export membrane protein